MKSVSFISYFIFIGPFGVFGIKKLVSFISSLLSFDLWCFHLLSLGMKKLVSVNPSLLSCIGHLVFSFLVILDEEVPFSLDICCFHFLSYGMKKFVSFIFFCFHWTSVVFISCHMG